MCNRTFEVVIEDIKDPWNVHYLMT